MSKPKRLLKATKRIIVICLILFLALYVKMFINLHVACIADVHGESMMPTFQSGQNLLLTNCTKRDRNPERFDVIVARTDMNGGEYIIKRVVGLPGETVQIADGNVWIDGAQLEDPYGGITMIESGDFSTTHELSDDEYFVLGDNRNNSEDSRFSDVGPIQRTKIRGRIVWSLWPFEPVY